MNYELGMNYLAAFFFAFLLTIVCTFVVKRLAERLGVVDQPAGGRKLHGRAVPLLGGVAIFLAFFLVLFVFWLREPAFFSHFKENQLLALFFGSLVLMIGGYLDDRFNLKPRWQILFPIVAALIILVGGVSFAKVTNPFGGTIPLDIFKFGGRLILVDLIVFGWLMGMMYTTKLLDGLDGLAAGLTAIGCLMIFFLANSQKFYQPDIALLALIFFGANLGFLLFNFHPAKIFLGEGGSLMTGFILGVLAIVAGGKIATTLLVMGIPALDVLVVIIRRLRQKQSPFQADAGHLHHRLLSLGFGQRQVVLFFYALATGFGVLTLFLQSREKLVALLILALIGIIGGLAIRNKKQDTNNI